MAGIAVSPLVAEMASVAQGFNTTTSFWNSFRVATVTGRLWLHLEPGRDSNPKEFFDLCLALSRGIDYALANNEIPDKVQDLPCLLKQICQRKNDKMLQAGVMVLMVSVKNACKTGWFSEMVAQELLTLANEIGNSFGSSGDVQINPSNSEATILTTMSRFYPLIKMGQILVSLVVKPGHGAYVVDFHISKTMAHSAGEKIRLLVVQTENTQTSACIITPQQASFLLNGRGVDRRSGAIVDNMPLIPTNVTGLLKYGTNLLQAVGQFNGRYIIVIAFMDITSSPKVPLEDYVQSAAAMADSESDVIEGPSRISLKCPISLKRISTPVKGCRCKHLQCFDFSNFVDINSRRPSWRCPHCNQHVCYTELRIDQNMVKVLNEVGEDITYIIISADGSWKAVLESDDNEDLANQNEQGSAQDSVPVPLTLDLTDGVDQIDTVVDLCNTEESKPVPAGVQNHTIMQSNLNSRTVATQNSTGHIKHEFLSGVYFSTLSSLHHISSDTQIQYSTSGPVAPVISPAFSRRDDGQRSYNTPVSSQSQYLVPANFPLQQDQLVNSISQNEYGRSTSIPRHVTRTPVAVQALAAPTLTPQQRPRRPWPPIPSLGGLSHTAAVQNTSRQDSTHIHNPSVPQSNSSQAPTPFAGPYVRSPNPHLQQTLNTRTPQPWLHPPSLIQPSAQRPRTGSIHGVGVSQSTGTGRYTTAVPQGVHMAGGMSASIASQSSTVSPRMDSSNDMQSEEGNWQATGKMRGSLSGRAYSAALSQFLNPSTQPQPQP